MQAVDLNQSTNEAKAKINAIKSYVEISKSAKELKKTAGNSLQKATSEVSSQLDKIKEKQKRFQREVPTSMDELLTFIGLTSGTGSNTIQDLRKKLLEVSVKIQPEVQEIIKRNAIKALGCSQEQTYIGIDPLQLQSMSLLPLQEGIYIPVSSIDFFYNLKNDPGSKFGEIYYEDEPVTNSPGYKPYGGITPFPMNKALYELLANKGQSYREIVGDFYRGSSQQDIFDIQYTTTNQYGVTGDYFRVVLLNRTDQNNQPSNQVGTLLSDYYSTISLVDPVDIGAQIANLLTGAMNVTANLGTGNLTNQSAFFKILQRILGLCFDSKREIDVSGVAKVAELDGIDDAFFELNEVDLRNIEVEISNIQNGVIEFVDCGNVKLPVNNDVLVSELVNFRQSLSGQSLSEQVETLEKIIDTITQNPEWNQEGITNLNLSLSINQSVIKKLPLAVAAGVLTPKVLLPIFTLLAVVQNEKDSTYNQAITDFNTFASSANTLSNQTSNVVTSGVDFLKKFRTFTVNTVSEIGALYLKTLFQILKRDIIKLLRVVLSDIKNEKVQKIYRIILRYVELALAVGQLIDDYRKCKSLIDNIIQILGLINGQLNIPKPEIPPPLLPLTALLPGTSPERSTINMIQVLQSYGIPTGALPDGSPNFMALFGLAMNIGSEKEKDENGKVEILTAAGVPGWGKSF
jgi:hypothetical protein